MNTYFDLMASRPDAFKNTDHPKAIRIITDPERLLQIHKKDPTVGVVYQDRYMILLKDPVTFPGGSEGTYLRTLSPTDQDGVVILPVDSQKRVLLLRHYRHAVRRFLWELPRGYAEAGCSTEENAARELQEECGLSASELAVMGRITPESASQASEPWVVFARAEGEPECNDLKEGIDEIRWFTQAEIMQMIAKGEITDAYTTFALLLAASQNRL